MSGLNPCHCINVTHRGDRCPKEPSEECLTCGDRLCRTCARRHHAHDTRPIRPPGTAT